MKGYDSYKDSGVEWIGKIPKHWKIVKLKYLANISFSSVDRHEYKEELKVNICHYPDAYKNDIINNETNLSNGTCTESEFEKFQLLEGQVIITKDSETANDIGVPTYVEETIENAVCGYHLAILDTISDELFGKYLFRYIQSTNVNSYFETNSNGVTRFGLGKPKIENLFISSPSFEEQTAIASFLDYKTKLIDATIEKKKLLITLLKEKRQAVINEAVTKGLNPNAPMKDSDVEWLGEIPEHWGLVPLRYLYNKIGSGVTPKGGGDVYTDEGVTFIRSQNVHFDGLRLDDVVKIDIETHQKMNNSSVEFNDVLLNITGASIGRCCVVNIDEEMNVNQHVCIIRVNERIKPDFLNIVLQSNVGQTQIKLLTTGGNREGLTQEAVKNMSIPLPNIETQIQLLNSITEKMKSFDLIKNKIETAIAKLQTYRQSLISEAVTGKIDVRDWEREKN